MNRLAVLAGERRGDEVVDDWKREACRLPRSCLRQSDQVSSGQREWYGLLLNRRWVRITRIPHCVQHFRREIEFRKGKARLGVFLTHYTEYTRSSSPNSISFTSRGVSSVTM